MSSIYDFSADTITGDSKKLSDYSGKVLLIVNTASKCGLTPQFRGLEDLYQQYKDQGLVILGFPCNQFAGQEPGSEVDIAEFCQLNYGVSFPMFAKIEVNGDHTHPLYQYLKQQAPGLMGSKSIKWNFTKFLISPDGRQIKRFAPTDAPEKLKHDIELLLS
ncbi:MAG: glutathione peroxidase [Shewanella sp.]|nr:glutathione peroxidase [Shewanella sp.]MCF1431960.1 glutathione peroxidase [Shewanella sp.]MCF1438197.1 glutathione peroxidase [Shewanella sp.]MCF1459570.1 glutathione peroxidase [Shewanella sp.]